ncbi:VCBS repeat-containing protein [Maribacter sp. MMG018]|uniref:VCBS repeat-containing protein n=1 Tax=Maribacter sp. MMG018 TaxID=2822688 RepID=UPI001B371454|nr:VCBS repeat-containing protein [Maribacter sp. MMG018]MBQ4913795.1 VCBS repeat-containing protein [Maribacter sp. MMG018]
MIRIRLNHFWLFCAVAFLQGAISSCHRDTLFEEVSERESGIDFSNEINETKSLSIIDYLYMYNGGGVAVGDVNNDGLPDIYFTSNQQSNKLYINRGDFSFEDVTDRAGVAGAIGASVWTNGVTMVDVNADGWKDIYVCRLHGFMNMEGGNQLFINNRNGTFTEKAEEYGLNARSYSQQASFFDYDLDGDLDMFLVNMSIKTPNTYKSSKYRTQRDSLGGDRLYENQDGFYYDISDKAGIYGGAMGYGLSVSIGDINNDNYPDIYVGNDFHENDYLYFNKGDGTFVERINESIGHSSTFSMGNDLADINNDGWLDIFTLDMKPYDEEILKKSISPDSYSIYKFKRDYGYHDQFARNMLQVNRGNLFGPYSNFSEVGELYGVDATDWSWGTLLADFDLDGKKDIFITNGIPHRPNDLDYINYTSSASFNSDSLDFKEVMSKMPDGKVPNMAFKNGDHGFEDVSEKWGLDLEGYSNGTVYADFDNDGDLDLVVNNLGSKASLYRNTATDRADIHFLKIKLQGRDSNKDGIGTRVSVWVGDTVQIQELSPVRGWLSSVEPSLTFGLGANKKIDSIEVDWKNGKKQLFRNLDVDTEMMFDYSQAKKVGVVANVEPPVFSTYKTTTGIDFTHRENEYIDFDYEALLPKMISTEGPRITMGDINNDGLEDLYIGGAKNQEGSLFIQQNNTEFPFVKVESEVFYKDRAEEDVEAVFIDVNSDGFLDLYVVSGSGEVLKDITGRDRLYINKGDNSFQKSQNHPQLGFNGSCVVKADFNGDGVSDLFVGGRSVPGAYGKYPASRVLLGDGVGRLYDFTQKIFSSDFKLGMVTDAVWLEKEKELAVVGDWMPITFIKLNRGTVGIREIENTSGWWNTIELADLDNDGDKDLLAGNRGLNSYLKATAELPANLYVKDFDLNSSIDPILTHYKNGIEVPFYGMDELSRQLVAIKKVYRTYESYAQDSFKEVFENEDLYGAGRWQVQTFESVMLENQGKGSFLVKPLPIEVQQSSVHGFIVDDFDNDGYKDILTVGNFYGNQVGLGKQDASYGQFIKGEDHGNWKVVDNRKSGFSISGEARDIAQISTAFNERLILISRNNDKLKVFKVD